jgi:DNA-directed RNA polymerase specialized sigma24 family protein
MHVPVAQAPSPLEAVALADELEMLMSRLEPKQRRVVELRLQGHKLEEIAADVQRSVRMVSHILEDVKQHLNLRHRESNGT